MSALGASPVIAGMIGKMFAPTVGTAKKLPAQCGRTAAQDRLHCPSMRREDGRSKTLRVRRPMTAEHISQLNHVQESAWECGVKFFQSLAGFLFAGGGQVRINHRCIQRVMAQVLADEAQAHPSSSRWVA
jgi:hypothetical protein